MPDKYYNGKFSMIEIDNGEYGLGEVEVPCKDWSITHSIGEKDATSTTSGGFYEVQGGIEKLEGKLTAQWDVSISPYSDGLGFLSGNNVQVTLYVGARGTGPAYQITNAFIKNVAVKGNAQGGEIVEYDIDFVSNGSFNLPS